MNYVHAIDREKIKGTITVDLLPWRERIAKVKELAYKIQEGQLSQRDEIELGEKQIDLTVSRIISVDISCGETHIESVDELMNYKEGMAIINEISPIIMNGVSLEKN